MLSRTTPWSSAATEAAAADPASGGAAARGLQRETTWLRCWVLDDTVQRYACITDLSPGGARIVTAQPPPRGSRVCVFLPQGQTCYEAQVVWSAAGFDGRGGVMGVQFLRRAPHPAIMKYLQQR